MSGGTAETNMTATKLAAVDSDNGASPINDAVASSSDIVAGGGISTTVIGTMIIEELITVTIENSTEEVGTGETETLHHSPAKMALIAAALSLIIILTIGGNILVVLSPIVSTRLRTVTYTFLVSLATADLLLGITVLPWSAIYTINSEWPFSVVFCNIYISCDVMFCTSSILHLLVISLERYFAITRPYAYQRKMSHKKAWIVIVIVWVVSLGVSFLPLHLGWNTADGSVQNYSHPSQCVLTWNMAYALFDGILLFFLPLILMLFVYARIVTIAYHQAKAIQSTMVVPAPSIMRGSNPSSQEKQENTNNNHRGVVDEHKAVKIIAVVMGSFVVCWVPYFTMFTFGPLCNWQISDLFYTIVLWLGYINSLINPLVYALMNREFRRAFKTILSCARWDRKCIGGFGSRDNDSQVKTPYLSQTNTRYNGSVVTYTTKSTSSETYASSESKKASDIYLKLFKTQEDIAEVDSAEERQEEENQSQESSPQDVELGDQSNEQQKVTPSQSMDLNELESQQPEQQVEQKEDFTELSPLESMDSKEPENQQLQEQPSLSPSETLELEEQQNLLVQEHEQEKVPAVELEDQQNILEQENEQEDVPVIELEDQQNALEQDSEQEKVPVFEGTEMEEEPLQEPDKVSSSDSIPIIDEDQSLLPNEEQEQSPSSEKMKLGDDITPNNEIIADLP